MDGKIKQKRGTIDPLNNILKRLLAVIQTPGGLIRYIDRERQFHDEPKFWYFKALLNTSFLNHDGNPFISSASGFSFFSHNEALLKCLAEAVERYCNYHFEESFVSRLASVAESTNDIVPLYTFARYSDWQLKNPAFQRYAFSSKQKIHWTDCIEFGSNKKKTSHAIWCTFPVPISPRNHFYILRLALELPEGHQ